MILHCVPTRVPLASDLPPTIEHFAFGEYRGLLQLVFETVDVLPRLGVLTCGSYQRIIMYCRRKCKMKDVVVSHVLDYHLVGTNSIPMACFDLVDEDPVIVKECPLTRSFSNFKVMSQASEGCPQL